MFNLLLQLHIKFIDVITLQRHRDLHDIPLPEGWIEPLIVRTVIRTTPHTVPDTTLSDNNDNSSSQVNVLDVRSTPSTYNTSLCFLFILSAGPSGSPDAPIGTLTDPWKGINILELPEENEFPLPNSQPLREHLRLSHPRIP